MDPIERNEKEIKMKVYSLLGFVDYEGQDLLGVFGSLEDLMEVVNLFERRVRFDGVEVISNFDQLGYVVSELGSIIDVLGEVEYL
jgi:hypothetical protein